MHAFVTAMSAAAYQARWSQDGCRVQDPPSAEACEPSEAEWKQKGVPLSERMTAGTPNSRSGPWMNHAAAGELDRRGATATSARRAWTSAESRSVDGKLDSSSGPLSILNWPLKSTVQIQHWARPWG